MQKIITIYLSLSFIMTLFTANFKSFFDNTTLLNLSLQVFIFGIPSFFILHFYFRHRQPSLKTRTSFLIPILISTIAFFTIDEVPLTIVNLLIITPICEELFFRGIIYNHLKTLSNHKPMILILISAIFFAIYHINPIAMTIAFPAGILLGFLYYHYNSLALNITIHSTLNYLLLILYSIPKEF